MQNFTEVPEVGFTETAKLVLVVACAVSRCILELLEELYFLIFHQSTLNY